MSGGLIAPPGEDLQPPGGVGHGTCESECLNVSSVCAGSPAVWLRTSRCPGCQIPVNVAVPRMPGAACAADGAVTWLGLNWDSVSVSLHPTPAGSVSMIASAPHSSGD